MSKNVMRMQRPPSQPGQVGDMPGGQVGLNTEALRLNIVITDLRSQLDAANFRVAQAAAEQKLTEVRLRVAEADADAMASRLKELGDPVQNYRHTPSVNAQGQLLLNVNKVPTPCTSATPSTAAAAGTAPTAE